MRTVHPKIGDIDEIIKAAVKESMQKQVSEVVEMLKVGVTKGTDSGVSNGATSKYGGGKYHFLPKGMKVVM